MRAAHPALDEEIAAGQFGGVMDWLRDNVHGVGARLPVQELIKQATGKPLTAAAYLQLLGSQVSRSAVSKTLAASNTFKKLQAQLARTRSARPSPTTR